MIKLGDMTIIGDVPPKLLKACAVIADTLHPEFARNPGVKPDISKESCVLCSLTVRDFLRRIGFVNACVRPVVTVMFAFQGGKQLHSLGIGVPDTPGPNEPDRWCGHMVVWIPGSRTLIDTTLFHAIRPQWPDLPPMIAGSLPPDERPEPLWGLQSIVCLTVEDDDRPGYEFAITYLDNPANGSWRRGPDARNRELRLPVADAMVAKFGRWLG